MHRNREIVEIVVSSKNVLTVTSIALSLGHFRARLLELPAQSLMGNPGTYQWCPKMLLYFKGVHVFWPLPSRPPLPSSPPHPIPPSYSFVNKAVLTRTLAFRPPPSSSHRFFSLRFSSFPKTLNCPGSLPTKFMTDLLTHWHYLSHMFVCLFCFFFRVFFLLTFTTPGLFLSLCVDILLVFFSFLSFFCGEYPT